MISNQTYFTKAKEIKRKWHLVDLKNKILGREATQISTKLIGKGKIYYVPNLDCGDYVIVINSDKLKLSGKKPSLKTYYRHSGYPGGLKTISFAQQMKKDSRKVVSLAVSRMLPKNKLRQQRLKRLKIFKDSNHPYKQKLEKEE